MARRILEQIDLGTLEDMTDEQLRNMLKKVSKVSNARAEYVKSIDPEYSAIWEYNRGGKFGKHVSYKDRESMINEITRSVQVGSKLTAGKAREEESLLSKVKANVDSAQAIPSDQFRRAFAWFREGHGQQLQSVYNDVKNIMSQLPEEEYITNAYNLISKLVEQKTLEEEHKRDEDWDELYLE